MTHASGYGRGVLIRRFVLAGFLPGTTWVFLALLSLPAVAQGQRVAVQRFGGPQGSSIRNAVVRSLENNGVEVIPQSEVNAAARELVGRTSLRDDDYGAVAQQLNIKAFVSGRISRARRRWTVRLTVRNGADGLTLGTASWGGRTVGSARSGSRRAYQRISEYLDLANAPSGAGAPTEQPDEIVAPDGEVPWYQRNQEDEEEDEDEEEEEEENDDDEPEQPGRYAKVRFAVLAGTISRSMGTTALVDPRLRTPFPMELDVNGDGNPRNDLIAEPREYESSGLGHFELGVAAEIYPGAFLEDPVVPWLGLAFHYRHSVGLNTNGNRCLAAQEPAASTGRCDGNPVVPVDTTQSELYVGPRVDLNLGDSRRGPNVSLDIGYGRFTFELAPNDLGSLDRINIVPPLQYTYVHLGLGARYDVHEYLGLGAMFAYRLGLGVGTAAKQIWGGQTSSTSGFTVGVDLRHPMTYLEDGVFLTLGIQFSRFSTKFRGQTACRVPDGDGMCPSTDLWEPWPEAQEGGAGVIIGGIQETVQDNYFRLALSVGYELR